MSYWFNWNLKKQRQCEVISLAIIIMVHNEEHHNKTDTK